MSLARAFTKRSKRPDILVPGPTRGTSIRRHNGTIDHNLISPPLALLSTTNSLAYDAPDLPHISNSSSSSVQSFDDSDSSPRSFNSSRGTTPDTSMIDFSLSPVEPNHLSTYFGSPGRSNSVSSEPSVPAIPSRALSHTKKSHQAVSRTRSQSRMSPPPNAVHNMSDTRSSVDMFSNKHEADHPFGAELEQVNELAEEFGAREVIILDEEEEYLISQGLRKFGAEDYVVEIKGLFGDLFEDEVFPLDAGWI